MPFPGSSGQQQRVFYKLKALRPHFHLTFLSYVTADQSQEVSRKLHEVVDDVLLLPSVYDKNRLWHRAHGQLYALLSGLKFSNYRIGGLEFSPSRVAEATRNLSYDLVLYEYWHSVDSVGVFRARNIPCVLDTHNILWQSYARQLAAQPNIPTFWKRRAAALYKRHEEKAWDAFDGLIAINAAERDYMRQTASEAPRIFYTPMGTDLEFWPYSWRLGAPPRFAYYGGLGSVHNQADALRCYHQIMPHIWSERPETEFWVVGSNPPPSIQALVEDKRVTVTGFVERPQDILSTMTAVLCPWSGTYGFRSRIVEVMALGVPVIATPEAVYGMEMEDGQGILFADTNTQLAQHGLSLLRDDGLAHQQSVLARQQIEAKYSFASTYGQLAQDLYDFACRSTKN